jgi:hypothetical protein
VVSLAFLYHSDSVFTVHSLSLLHTTDWRILRREREPQKDGFGFNNQSLPAMIRVVAALGDPNTKDRAEVQKDQERYERDTP